MRIPLRFRLVPQWLASRLAPGPDRGNVGLGDLIRVLVEPSAAKRAAKIMVGGEAEKAGELLFEVPATGWRLRYPAEMSLADFHAAVDMTFDPRHWHHYWKDDWRPPEGSIVIDAGAAEGIFTLDVARSGCEVIAFEPLALFREVFARNTESVTTARMVGKAVGAVPEMASISGDGMAASVGAAGAGEEVEVTTIDEECAGIDGEISMIKADIEGFEYDMLLGAREVIAAHRPRMAITVYHDQNNLPQIRDFLLRLHADYRFETRGLAPNGHPVMLHVW